jgi:hypothetical protein
MAISKTGQPTIKTPIRKAAPIAANNNWANAM